MKLLQSIILSGCLVAGIATAGRAATLSGQVKDPSGAPAADVQVVIPALRAGARTDASGSYKLENVPPGSYAVEFRPVDYAKVVKQADLSKGDLVMDAALTGTPFALTPITISAAPKPQPTLTTPASVTVVEGRQLDKQQSQSIISAIQDEPGVNMIAEGPTVVKPEIRGLQSQDIVVVQDGVRSEALQWGNEHAPEIDAMGTERIEVLRGPNSLLYGSDALGGVISVSHAELPDSKLGAGALSGKVVADVQSVNKSVGEGAQLAGALGDWGWRTNLSQRQAGNFRNPQGEVPNTGEQEVSGDGQIGVRKDWGNVSLEYGRFNKRVELQNPSAPFPAPFDDDEYQALGHDHGVVHANYFTGLARIESITGFDRADRKEYDHQSPVDPTNQVPHLHWMETSYTEDLRAHLEPMGPFQGTLGLSGLLRNEQDTGETHLNPGYNESSIGEYLYEEVPAGKFSFSFGVRGDQTHYGIDGDNLIGIDPDIGLDSPHPVAKQSLNYTAISGAVGGVYHATDPLAFAVNVGRGYRNPIPFELFAYGKHEGTGQFLIGNPGLRPETSLNTDASVRWASDRLKGEVGVFRNYITNYIYSTYTNQFYDENTGAFTTNPDPTHSNDPVVNSAQTKATIQGVDYAVKGAATDWLTLRSVGNLVRGDNNSTDSTLPTHNLPHVPADNILFGAEVHQKRLASLSNPYFGADIKLTGSQHRTGPEEIPTGGYTLVNLKTGTEFLVMNNRLTLDAGVNNLFNRGYIDFNSILKEFNIENPGRNVYVRVSAPFGS